MITVKVDFHAYLAKITQSKTANLKLSKDNSTVDDLLRRILSRYSDELKAFIIDTETDQLNATFFVLVNGTEISSVNGLKTRLKDGDEVSIIPPLGGG